MPPNCCDQARPLASNPCIRVWLGMPQLAAYKGQIEQARIACRAPEFPQCTAEVANACPKECAAALVATTQQQGQGQQGQGQQGQGQQGQGQAGAQPCELPQQCPFPSMDILQDLMPCLGDNETMPRSCCQKARPLARNPCIRVWLSMPEMAGLQDKIDKFKTGCGFNDFPQCADDVQALCPAECSEDQPIFKGFCELPEECALPAPEELMSLMPCLDKMNETNKQLCCDAASPLASHSCVKIWLQLPVLRPFLPQINQARQACQLPDFPDCTDEISTACPKECASALDFQGQEGTLRINVHIQGQQGQQGGMQSGMQGQQGGMQIPKQECKQFEEWTSCSPSSCFENKCLNGKVVVPGPICTADCRQGCKCKDGYVRNNAGLCISNQECTGGSQCQPLTCKMNCPYGFQKDAKGCDICQCSTAPAPKPKCPDVMCAMYCENGFQKDANGCDICQCNQAPSVSTTITTRVGKKGKKGKKGLMPPPPPSSPGNYP